MIPKDCKRLGEVDFPMAVVSKHSAREKSIRHGHPSTLHLWWARRPLAACRSMLMALLLPDPGDALCPQAFKVEARALLLKTRSGIDADDTGLRRALLKFIGDFANWDLSSDRVYLEVARGLVKAAHPEETPLVVDPFAGGGSIPVEALRLGCDAIRARALKDRSRCSEFETQIRKLTKNGVRLILYTPVCCRDAPVISMNFRNCRA
jgi:putative DNA methylase